MIQVVWNSLCSLSSLHLTVPSMNRLNQTEPASFSIVPCWPFFRDSYFLFFFLIFDESNHLCLKPQHRVNFRKVINLRSCPRDSTYGHLKKLYITSDSFRKQFSLNFKKNITVWNVFLYHKYFLIMYFCYSIRQFVPFITAQFKRTFQNPNCRPEIEVYSPILKYSAYKSWDSIRHSLQFLCIFFLFYMPPINISPDIYCFSLFISMSWNWTLLYFFEKLYIHVH
jgi:hypothetical protein